MAQPGRCPWPRWLSTSKAAVRSFARTFSAKLRTRRIRVNAVSPGLIDTPSSRGVGQSEYPGQTEAEFKDYLARAAKQIPFGRLGRPEEVAAAVLSLPGSRQLHAWLGTGSDSGLAELFLGASR